MARKIVSQQQKTYRNTYGSLGGRSEGNGRADKGEGDDGLHFDVIFETVMGRKREKPGLEGYI